MQYIVLDMEWNQPWPGSYAAQKVLPVQIHGEIIQIGAVRLLETGKIADEFQVLVRPKYSTAASPSSQDCATPACARRVFPSPRRSSASVTGSAAPASS